MSFFLRQTLVFFTHGDTAHAAAACTRGFGFFKSDHNKRTPSSRSIVLNIFH